jgi:hypothetical protein
MAAHAGYHLGKVKEAQVGRLSNTSPKKNKHNKHRQPSVRIAVRIFTNYPDPNFQTLPSLQPSDYSLNPHQR